VTRDSFFDNSRTQTANATDRDEFYKELYADYSALKQAKSLVRHIDSKLLDMSLIEDKARAHILKQLSMIADKGAAMLERKNILSRADSVYAQFNRAYDHLRSFSEFFEEIALSDNAKSKMKELEQKFDNILNDLTDKAKKDEKDRTALINTLILIKSMTVAIPVFKKKIDEAIDCFLLAYKKRQDNSGFAMLGVALNAHEEGKVFAQMIIAEHSVLKDYALSLRNEKTLRFGIDQILDTTLDKQNVPKGLWGDDVNAQKLKKWYEKFAQAIDFVGDLTYYVAVLLYFCSIVKY
jgi:hypothetical protein